MEIYSLRSLSSSFSRNGGRDNKDLAAPAERKATSDHFVQFEIAEDPESPYTSITPSQLREMATESFESGEIDQETYAALADELPMQALDRQGQIIDLSDITDDTPFDFQDYYKNQLEIAMTMGDDESAKVLKSVVDFLGI